MIINTVSIKDAEVIALNPAQEENKTVVTLDKQHDEKFVASFGKNGVDITLRTARVEEMGLTIGSRVDYNETSYSLLTCANYEEVHSTMMPSRTRGYILTEMVNRMEACDEGKISERQRDEYFSVVDAKVSLSQTQTTVAGEIETKEDVQGK